MSVESNTRRIEALEAVIAAAVIIQVPKWYQSTDLQPGDWCYGGSDPNIFAGDNFIGPCLSVPVVDTVNMDASNTSRW